jgi:hypothetical protein
LFGAKVFGRLSPGGVFKSARQQRLHGGHGDFFHLCKGDVGPGPLLAPVPGDDDFPPAASEFLNAAKILGAGSRCGHVASVPGVGVVRTDEIVCGIVQPRHASCKVGPALSFTLSAEMRSSNWNHHRESLAGVGHALQTGRVRVQGKEENHFRRSPEPQGRTADGNTQTDIRTTRGHHRPRQTLGQNRRQERLRRGRTRSRRGLRSNGADRRRRHGRVGRRHPRTTRRAADSTRSRRDPLSRLPEALSGRTQAPSTGGARGHRHAPRTRCPLPDLSPGFFPPNGRFSNLTLTATVAPSCTRSSTPALSCRRSSWRPGRFASWPRCRSAVGTSGA